MTHDLARLMPGRRGGRGVASVLRVVVALVACVLGTTALHAQHAPQHTRAGGWVLVPGEETGDRILVYIPPRATASAHDAGPGGTPILGQVQRVQDIGARVDAIAAIDGRAVLVLAPEARAGTDRGPTIRRVLRVSAYRSPAAAVWYFEPRGRMETLPSLPGSGELVAVAEGELDGRLVPMVQIRGLSPEHHAELGGTGVPEGDTTLGLTRRTWAVVPFPIAHAPDAARPAVVRLVDGPAWVVSDEGRWWRIDSAGARAPLAPPASGPDREAPPASSATPASARPGWLASPDVRMHAVGSGVLVFRAQSSGRLALALWDASGWFEIGDPVDPDLGWGAAVLDAGARFAVITASPDADAPSGVSPPPGALGAGADEASSRARVSYIITELSPITGELLYRGETTGPRVISPVAMQALLVGVVMLTGAALFVALRPDPLDGAVPLPTGVPLASHGQRVCAQLIDVLFALGLAGLITGTSVLDLLRWDSWLHTYEAWTVAVFGYILLWAHTVTMDALVGGSLGRMFTGTRVVRLEAPVAGGQTGPGPGPGPGPGAGTGSGAGVPDGGEPPRAGGADPADPGARGGRSGHAGVAASAYGLRPPRLGQSLLRNTLKLALPPLGLMMFLDPSGRHRAEQLSRTAVVTLPGSGRPEPGAGDP